MLADLLTQGAGAHDAFMFDDAVQGLGAQVQAGASWQHTTVSLSALSRNIDQAMPLLADAVIRPTLKDADFARKQKERLGELTYYASEPRVLVQLAAARALFKDTRQGTSSLGTPRSVTAMSAADVRALHTTTFRPDNVSITIVGDLDKKAATAALERAFGAWAVPSTSLRASPTQAEPAPLSGVRVVLLDKPQAPQSVVRVVAPIPDTITPFHAPSAVVRTLLGGSFTSRLNTNLREKNQYAYGASYGYELQPTHRSSVSTSVKSQVTIPAIAEIIGELTRIRSAPTAEELERARAYEALTFPDVLDSGGGLAASWASWAAARIAPATVADYMKRVLAVDAAAFEAAAKQLVDPSKIVIVVVGDAKAHETDLKMLGAAADGSPYSVGAVERITAAALLP